jgi:hypothetical protein
MSPARSASIALLVFLLVTFVSARAENYLPGPQNPIFLFSGPVVLPDTVLFRMTLMRNLNLSAPTAPRQFRVEPADDGLSVALPGQSKPRRFSFPRVRILYRRDNVCYYGRSYRYKRESRDSDLTVPAGYTTCTPRSKFQVKNAAPTP